MRTDKLFSIILLSWSLVLMFPARGITGPLRQSDFLCLFMDCSDLAGGLVETSPALTQFQQINHPGFTDDLNRYAWSMVVFNEELYVGTWNMRTSSIRHPDSGAQVFRYLDGTEWEQVVDGGLGNDTNNGLRSMIVWDAPDDPDSEGEAIYGTTMNMRQGLEVWRTFDGANWEVLVGKGAPYPNGFDAGRRNNSGRGMIAYEVDGQEWLYLGTHGGTNGEIWRTLDGEEWEKVTDARALGLGNNSICFASMCIYQDDPDKNPALFVGSWNRAGFSVVKSYDGVHFETVANRGITKQTNQGMGQLIVFNGRLWILGINYIDGFDIFASKSGTIESNDDWDLIATEGLTDRGNKYAWRAIEYDNGTGPRLYIGVFNYARGYMLYSITPDMEYAIEVGPGAAQEQGMGDRRNYGARTLAVYQDRLVVGLASSSFPTTVWMMW